MRENFHTLLRVLLCCIYVWLMEVGSYAFPVSSGDAMLFATVAGVLLAYELAIRDVRPRWVVTAVLVTAVAIVQGFAIYRAHLPPPPTGPLRPAGEPTPPMTCHDRPGPGDLVMAFGTNRVIGKGNGPFTPFKLTDCPVLSLKRTGKGLTVNDIGYDDNNDIAFMIRNGIYQPMQQVQLRVVRPDASTFLLLDGYNQEALYVRYLNPGAVRIRGRFLCGDAQAVITDDRILLGGKRFFGVQYGKRHPGPARGCLTVPSPPSQAR